MLAWHNIVMLARINRLRIVIFALIRYFLVELNPYASHDGSYSMVVARHISTYFSRDDRALSRYLVMTSRG